MKVRALTAGLLAVALAACSSGSSSGGSAPTSYLAVRLTNASDFTVTGSTCHGTGLFSDVTAGEQVSVIEAGGTVASTAKLTDGIHDTSGACEFDEPIDAPLSMSYTVAVGARQASGPYTGSVGLITITLD